MKVLILSPPQNSNEDHPVKMFSFHSHMLDISPILDSVKFFMTINVWADTVSACSLLLSFTAFR